MPSPTQGVKQNQSHAPSVGARRPWTDLMLPGATGPAIAERLRQRVPGVKVLLMSGYAEHSTRCSMPRTRRASPVS